MALKSTLFAALRLWARSVSGGGSAARCWRTCAGYSGSVSGVLDSRGSGAGKIGQTPGLGGFGVGALRESPAVVGRTLYVTEPPWYWTRLNRLLVFFVQRIRHV